MNRGIHPRFHPFSEIQKVRTMTSVHKTMTLQEIADTINSMCSSISHLTPTSCWFEKNPTYDPSIDSIVLTHEDGSRSRVGRSHEKGVHALIYKGKFEWSPTVHVFGAFMGSNGTDVGLRTHGGNYEWMWLNRYRVTDVEIIRRED